MSILSAILLGFGLHFIRNFVQILGENGQLPIFLAAWSPPIAALALAFGLMLQMEDAA
jgi:lipopolysaccharide export system permease protein